MTRERMPPEIWEVIRFYGSINEVKAVEALRDFINHGTDEGFEAAVQAMQDLLHGRKP